MFKNILCVALSFLIISCSKHDSSSNKIIVGTSADNTPYEYISDGKIVGFDVELINLIARELDKEVVIKNLDFNGLLPALLNKNIDLSVAAISVTPERQENADFSEAYLDTEMTAIYKENLDIKSAAELSTKIIGAQMGTTWEQYANQLVAKSHVGRVKSLSNNLALIQELNNGNVDFVIMETLQANKFRQKYPNLKSFDIPETRNEFSIAFPKNSDLKTQVNEVLQKFRDNGTLDSLKSKWLAQ